MSRTHRVRLPVTAEQVRDFSVGDLVVIDGEIVTAPGMTTHERILEHIEGKRELPFSLDHAAFFHLPSYNVDTPEGMKVLYMNPTTSTRYNAQMPDIIRHFHLHIVCGKGGLDVACTEAMKEVGCVYLSILGGGVALHADAMREVVEVGWPDLVSQYRLVKMRVEGLGPLTVAIDAHGNNVYLNQEARARSMLPELMAELNATRLKMAAASKPAGK
jgi:fumarate hydratase subunit beta